MQSGRSVNPKHVMNSHDKKDVHLEEPSELWADTFTIYPDVFLLRRIQYEYLGKKRCFHLNECLVLSIIIWCDKQTNDGCAWTAKDFGYFIWGAFNNTIEGEIIRNIKVLKHANLVKKYNYFGNIYPNMAYIDELIEGQKKDRIAEKANKQVYANNRKTTNAEWFEKNPNYQFCKIQKRIDKVNNKTLQKVTLGSEAVEVKPTTTRHQNSSIEEDNSHDIDLMNNSDCI